MPNRARPTELGLLLAAVAVAAVACREEPRSFRRSSGAAEAEVRVAVSDLVPAAERPVPNPYGEDEEAIGEGERLFEAMNCSGCHAPLGGGGMGPPLSDDDWIYGGDPGDIYLSIAQGRPNGMPVWGDRLPPDMIWKIVAYVGTLSERKKRLEAPSPAPRPDTTVTSGARRAFDPDTSTRSGGAR